LEINTSIIKNKHPNIEWEIAVSEAITESVEIDNR